VKKLLLRVLIVIIALGVIVFLARNVIARKSIEIATERITGFPLEVGSVNVGVFQSRVDARDIKLHNPDEFQDKLFVDMPQLSVDYQLPSMLSGVPHINEMLINIKQLVIVKNQKGESNAMKLKGVLSTGDSKAKYRIGTLHLKVGTVIVKDYSKGVPIERTLPANINITYNNITEATPITRLALMTVMSQVRLPEIGVKPEDLRKGLESVAGTAREVVKDATKSINTASKGLLDTIKQAIPQQKQQGQ
jgi:hypothetical protein